MMLVCDFLFSLNVVSQDSEKVIISSGPNKAVIYGSPFRIDLFSGDQLVIRANAQGLMKFEHYRLKTNP